MSMTGRTPTTASIPGGRHGGMRFPALRSLKRVRVNQVVAGKMVELNEATTLPLPQPPLDDHCSHCSSVWLRAGWPHTCSQGRACDAG